MVCKESRLRRPRLESSCTRRADWIRCGPAVGGVQLLSAWFAGAAFARHRHDTYAIGLTDSGIQSFGYRGSLHRSTRGEVVVLHPDEPHDGFAGSEEGFGYRILYVDPARISAACEVITGRCRALPFVRRPVLRSARLARTIETAFACALEPLAVDAVVLQLAESLLEEATGTRTSAGPTELVAVARARAFLDAACDRVVRSAELEAASGLSRFALARQFRSMLGTSPYRYSLMRRLEYARDRLDAAEPAASAALAAGFADQAHFTRVFRAAFGLTPMRYRTLKGPGVTVASRVP